MIRTAEPHVDPGAPPSAAAEELASAWAALRGHIAARSRELDDEVRRYPTPIARCDDQLPKLLEQRGHAFRQRRLADEADAAAAGMPSSVRASHLAQFLAASAGSTDDDVETALRQRLADAVSAYSTPPPTAATRRLQRRGAANVGDPDVRPSPTLTRVGRRHGSSRR